VERPRLHEMMVERTARPAEPGKEDTMNKEYRDAIASLRKELGVKRLDPRSLVKVDDGAMCWLTTRKRLRAAPLWARRCLAKSDREGRRPDRYSYPETRDEDDNGNHNPKGYTAACSHVACLSACGDYPHHELPDEFMENVPNVGDLY